MQYAYSRATHKRFDEASKAVEATALAHGFVVSRVYDMHATLAAKGFDIAPLRIYVLADGPGDGGVVSRTMQPDLDCKVYVHADERGALVTALRPTIVCGSPDLADDVPADEDTVRRVADLVDAVVA